MVVYPMSNAERKAVLWAVRLMPAMALGILVLLGACSITFT